MQHQILRAEGKGALDLAAKGCDALGADLYILAAHVDQVAGMNHERPHVEGFARSSRMRSACLGSTLGARHMRGLEVKI